MDIWVASSFSLSTVLLLAVWLPLAGFTLALAAEDDEAEG